MSPTIWSGRTQVTTNWSGRPGVASDLGYLITQLGILNTNDGRRIIFNTGIFTEQPTQWSGRPII